MQRPLEKLAVVRQRCGTEILWRSKICSFAFTHRDGVNYGSSFFKMHQTIIGAFLLKETSTWKAKWNWHNMGLMLTPFSKVVISCLTTHGFDWIETVELVLIVCPGSRWYRDVFLPTYHFWRIENCLLTSCSHNPTPSVPNKITFHLNQIPLVLSQNNFFKSLFKPTTEASQAKMNLFLKDKLMWAKFDNANGPAEKKRQ